MDDSSVSIAVMPFRDMSPEPETAYFAAGFVEDLIANLTRFGSLRVIAGQSTFGLAQTERSTWDVAGEWGLHYILEGSVRNRQDTLRVATQLIRVEGWQTEWAERFDGSADDVFAIQDEITATVAGKVAVHIDHAQLDRARRTAFEDLRAYDCWLRGLDCLRQGTLEGDEEARPFFRQALEIDPRCARAYSGLSLSHFNEWSCQAWHLWDESAENAFDYATKAVELDQADAMAHAVLARVSRFRHQHAQADRHAADALALNPNDPHVLIQVAIATLFNGEPDDACVLARKAVRLNPLHGHWYHGIVGWCLFMAGRHADALPHLARAGETIVNFAAYRAACAILGGDLARARSEYDLFVREYREKIAFGRMPEPGEALRWAVQVEPFRRLDDSRRMPDVLQGAGFGDVDVSDALRKRPGLMVRPADLVRPPGNVFARDGRVWSVDYEGIGAKLVGLKGFDDIARLLGNPHEPIHCVELAGSPPSLDSGHEVIDVQARGEYRRRIRELQGDLDEANADNDPARAHAIRAELEDVIDELTRATGVGGRSRKLGDGAERARSAVTWRIRSAIKKIHAAHPRLGQHLRNCIQTGTFCVYSPEKDTEWRV